MRDNGKKVQVKYLANPSGKWRNEHHICFDENLDDYGLIIFEDLMPKTLICFKKDSLENVCTKLQKRHKNLKTTLQFTQKNYKKDMLSNAKMSLKLLAWRFIA